MRKPRRSALGQTLVLGCMTLLTMALMLMVSFTLTNAIHERIRLQAFADSQAYSMAIVQARAFNTVAYMNRAIAAALVAEITLTNWRAIASHDVTMWEAGAEAMGLCAIEEVIQCPPYSLQHCAHAIQAGIDAAQMMMERMSASNDYDDLKDSYKDAVEAFSKMIKDIHGAQKHVIGENGVKDQMSDTIKALKDICAPQATDAEDQLSTNFDNFKGAIEDGNGGSDRADVMEKAATDSRPYFARSGMYAAPAAADDYTSSMMQMIPLGMAMAGMTGADTHAGAGGMGILDVSGVKDKAGNEGTWIWAGTSVKGELSDSTGKVTSKIKGGLIVIGWKDCFIGAGYTHANVNSDDADDYKGSICEDDDNCFVNYKGDTSGDMNQPSVYGSAHQDLNKMRSGLVGPWELGNKGKVKVKSNDTEWNLTFAPQNEGYAVAKAKAYFHQIRGTDSGGMGWKNPPNLFDPFWRAKLHQFKDHDELKEVAERAGDDKAADFKGSVEGQ